MRRGALGLGLLLASCGGPCSGGAPIVDVDVRPPPPTAALELDLAAARSRVEAAADALDGFSVRPAEAEEVGWQLTARPRLATERTDDEDATRVRRALGLAVELERLKPARDGEIGRFVAEGLEVRVVPRGAPTAPLVAAAVDTVMARLSTSIELSRARPERLARAIREGDPHARAVATRIARARGLEAARPALEARLAHDDVSPREALQLAGALADIGHPDSAGALIDTISRFPKQTVPLLYLLGRIGGREATAYLFTVKSGHEEAGVRAAAEEALAEALEEGAESAEAP
jgi:hypothetical protein